MRKYISSTIVNQNFINDLVYRHDKEIKQLKESFDKLQEKTKVNAIFFEGQIYDAYSLLLDILNSAKDEIIIIDNYSGKELFDVLIGGLKKSRFSGTIYHILFKRFFYEQNKLC